MTDTEPKVALINDELLRKIKIDRLEDNKGGFQRRLDERKVVGVIKSVQEGKCVPPIMLAEIDGELFCDDGQHRLEARRRKAFTLYAQINKSTKKEAAANFVTMNGTASRVSRRHRLMVDPAEYATHIRSLGRDFDADVSQVEPLINGITNYRPRRDLPIKPEEWKLARTILKLWSKDKRWKRGLRGGKDFYASPATLVMLGTMCKEKPNDAPNVVTALQQIDYGARSPMGKHYGSNHKAQAVMKNYALRFIFKNARTVPQKVA